MKEAARVARIVSLLDSKTGKVTKKAPRCLGAKQSAVIEVKMKTEFTKHFLFLSICLFNLFAFHLL